MKSEGTSSHTSPSLIQGAQANDADSWNRLVNTYSRRVYRWCRQSGLQPADCGNVTQEVLRAVARKLVDFHYQRESDTFRGWIHRITQNKLRDFFRDGGRWEDVPVGGTDAHLQLARFPDSRIPQGRSGEDPASSTGGSITSVSSFRKIDRVSFDRLRGQITDRDWRLFWRTAVDGQSAVEVGEEYGVTANTVRIVKMRVLRRLRAGLILLSHGEESSV